MRPGTHSWEEWSLGLNPGLPSEHGVLHGVTCFFSPPPPERVRPGAGGCPPSAGRSTLSSRKQLEQGPELWEGRLGYDSEP